MAPPETTNKTKTKTAVRTTGGKNVAPSLDQQQSLEVLKTMIHGSLSIFLYTSGCFHKKAYAEQRFPIADDCQSYEDFAAGMIPNIEDVPLEEIASLNVLRRGYSSRADRLLDCLETAIYPALAEQNLRALEVYLHPDQDDREKAVEVYTMRFTYPKSGHGGKTFAGLHFSGPGNLHVAAPSANAAVYYLFRQLSECCQGVLPSPSKGDPFISMVMRYEDGIDPDNQPKGWVQKELDLLFFPKNEDSELRRDSIAGLQSGHHTAGVQITYPQMKSIGFQDNVVVDVAEHTPLRNFAYDEAVDIFEDAFKTRVWNPWNHDRPTQQNSADKGNKAIESANAGRESDRKEPARSDQAQAGPSTVGSRGSTSQMRESERLFSAVAGGKSSKDASVDGPQRQGRQKGLALKAGKLSVNRKGKASVRPTTLNNPNMDDCDDSEDLPKSDESRLEESINTQSSNVPAMPNFMRRIQHLDQPTQGDTQPLDWFTRDESPARNVSRRGLERDTDDDARNLLVNSGATGSALDEEQLESQSDMMPPPSVREPRPRESKNTASTVAPSLDDTPSVRVTRASTTKRASAKSGENTAVVSKASAAKPSALRSGPSKAGGTKATQTGSSASRASVSRSSTLRDNGPKSTTTNAAASKTRTTRASAPSIGSRAANTPSTPPTRHSSNPTLSARSDLDLRASVAPIKTPRRPSNYQDRMAKRVRDEDLDLEESDDENASIRLSKRIRNWQTEFVIDGNAQSSPAALSSSAETVVDL